MLFVTQKSNILHLNVLKTWKKFHIKRSYYEGYR